METEFKRVQEEINDFKYLESIDSLCRRDEVLLRELEILMKYAEELIKLKK